MQLIFEVDNGKRLEVFQNIENGRVYLITKNSNGDKESRETIHPEDFVAMLNWSRNQTTLWIWSNKS